MSMKALAFGEILFDVYENERKLGGAPMNFAAHIAKLGAEAYILSAVGNDCEGREAISEIENIGVNTELINILENKKTGKCKVTYKNNEPNYDLSELGAYDYINACDFEKIKDKSFDIFYFGTLAQRNDVSMNTLYDILNNIKFKYIFFDMNLRQSYYNDDMILNALGIADIVKVNRDEFIYLKSIIDVKDSISDELLIKEICEKFNIKILLLTLDSKGALVYDGDFYFKEAGSVEFVSAVGAGDSFCACFLKNFFDGESIDVCINRANKLAGYVVGFEAAIPEYDMGIFNNI